MNPDSSAPTHAHARSLRTRGIFREVHSCFWKEEPSMREVLRMVESAKIYIVPVFISEGYFTQTVIPRELELEGRITLRDGREIYYCDPVGKSSANDRSASPSRPPGSARRPSRTDKPVHCRTWH